MANKQQIQAGGKTIRSFVSERLPGELRWLILIATVIGLISLQTGVIVGPNPALVTGIIFLALFAVPGFLFALLLFKPGDVSTSQLAALSPVLGIGLLIIPATLLLLLRSSLGYLSPLAIVLSTVLVFVHLLRPELIQRWGAQILTRTRWTKLNILLLALFLAVLLATMAFFSSEAGIWAYGDRWTYTAWIRQFAEFTHLDYSDPRYAAGGNDARALLSGFLVLEAFLSRIAGLDPIQLFSLYLPPVLLGVSLLAFYGLARELFRNANAALFACLIHVTYLASTMQTGHGYEAGFQFFMRIAEDKMIAAMIILPAALTLMLRYVRQGNPRLLLAFGLCAIALALTHPLGVPLFVIAFTAFALIHLLFEMKREIVRRLAAISLIIAIPLFLLILQRVAFGSQSQLFSLDFADWLKTSDPDYLAQSYRLKMLSNGRYMAHPGLIESRPMLLTILLTPLLLFFVRRSYAAQFLFSNMVLPLAILFNPITAPLLGQLITPLMLQRLSVLLPVALVLTFFLYWLVRGLQEQLAKHPYFPRNPLVLQLIPILLVALPAFLLRNEIDRGITLFVWRMQEGTVPADEQALLSYVSENVTAENTIMAASYTCYYLPAYSTKANLVLGSIRNPDVLDFYNAEVIDDALLDILRRHNVTYVILEAGHPLARAFNLLPSLFSQVYSNNAYGLYQVDLESKPEELLAGYSHLVRGEWAQAIAAYDRAIEASPDDVSPYLGLAQAYHELERPQDAITAYRHAAALAAGDEGVRDYLASETDVDPSIVLDYLAQGESYQTQASVDVAYNLLDHLHNTKKMPDDLAQAYQSAFVIDRMPRGVISQHPPSRISYQLQVPANARLAFSLAMAPEIWQLGKGDGVRFEIELQDESGATHHLHSEYIDPKNVAADRKWHDRELDLSFWSGQMVVLSLITDPGPNGDSRYDWAGWGEPRLVQPVAYDFLARLSDAETVLLELGQVLTATQTINHDTRTLVFQHPTSQAIFSLELPHQSTLRFGLGTDPTSWSPDRGDGLEYNVYVRDPSEPSVLHLVFQRYLDPKSNPNDRRWFDEQVDLGHFGDQVVDIIFEALPGPAGDVSYDWGGWSTPVLIDETLPDNRFGSEIDAHRNPP